MPTRLAVMTREQTIDTIDDMFCVQAEYPWDEETNAVFRHPVSGKWFAIIMDVKKKNLHLEGETYECIMNVKCNPLLIEDLLHEEGFLPAYHMNKKHWVTLRISLLQKTTVMELLSQSYSLVAPKVKRTATSGCENGVSDRT